MARLTGWFDKITDANDEPVSGALVYVYAQGTTTEVNVYQDEDLSVAATNPIVCDSAGVIPDRYAATGTYKIAVTTSEGVSLRITDNIQIGGGGGTAILKNYGLTRAAAVTTSFDSSVAAVQTTGYSANGDFGAALHKLAASEPSHDGKFQDGDDKWWELAERFACPEMFGAVGDGSTDDIAALDKLAAWQAATGGLIVMPRKLYGISRPWEMSHDNIRISAEGGRTHNTPACALVKLSGFSGAAGLITRQVTTPTDADILRGVNIQGIYVSGDESSYRAGGGFLFSMCSYVTVRDCQAQYNLGPGVEYDGCWVVTEDACAFRFNGDSSAGTGGGRKLTNSTRANSQHWRRDFIINNNENYDEFWEDGGGTNLRPVGIYTYGGIEETITGTYTGIVIIESADRSHFFGTHFAQESGESPPCMILGSDTASESIDGLGFFGCYWQHSNPGPDYAIETYDNIDNVAFINPVVRVSNSKFIDATNTNLTNIFGNPTAFNILGGDIDANEYTDPNGVIVGIGGKGVHLARQPGSAGTELFLYDRTGSGTPIRIMPDGTNTDWYLRVGVGTDGNLVEISEGMGLFPNPAASAPTNPSIGTLANSDGTGSGFDGVSGPGLYRYDGSGWGQGLFGSFPSGTKTWDPASIAHGATDTTTLTVTGAALGDYVVPSFSRDLQGLTLTAYVQSADTVEAVLSNQTGGAIDLASGTLSALVMKL